MTDPRTILSNFKQKLPPICEESSQNGCLKSAKRSKVSQSFSVWPSIVWIGFYPRFTLIRHNFNCLPVPACFCLGRSVSTARLPPKELSSTPTTMCIRMNFWSGRFLSCQNSTGTFRQSWPWTLWSILCRVSVSFSLNGSLT